MTIRRTSILLCALALCWAGLTPSPTLAQAGSATASKQPQQPESIYDETADAKTQIADALAKAKKENRRVLIQWGANWCGWCHLLHDTFETDAKIKRKLLYEYDLVLIDIGKWDKNMELAAEYGADLKGTGVPYLTVLDADGKVVRNQRTDELELKNSEKPGHDVAKVLEFLENNQAAYLSAGAVMREALSQARQSNRVVFVHFGAPWCIWCHRLEDWLAQPETAAIMAKDFVEVKIDTDRMIGGSELLLGYREAEGGGIPWFAFLTPEGKKIVTSDGPNGNVGCPWNDDEIDLFGGMLRKAKRSLSDAAVDRLLATLRATRDATK